MNNVGALALLMPVALQVAARLGMPPGQVLMPLAFGSILGGMTTLIGTPPNLIVSGFRAAEGGSVRHVRLHAGRPGGRRRRGPLRRRWSAGGWCPSASAPATEGFETGAYLTEARVGEDSSAVGHDACRRSRRLLEDADAQVVGMVRNDVRVTAPSPGRCVAAGDILVIEAEAEALAGALSELGLKLEEVGAPRAPTRTAGQEEAGRPADERFRRSRDRQAAREEIVLVELAVLPGSELVGRSASELRLRTRYGINLLAAVAPGAAVDGAPARHAARSRRRAADAGPARGARRIRRAMPAACRSPSARCRSRAGAARSPPA